MFRKPPTFEVVDINHVRRLADGQIIHIDDTIRQQLPEFVRRCLAFQWNQAPQTQLLPKLYPFQRQGVRKANVFRGSILFADEMGVGKTFQALATVHYQGGRTLIICPSYLKSNWQREAAQKAAIATIILPSSKAVQNQSIGEGNWIVSYDVAAKQQRLLAAAGFQNAIFDESHMIKNPRSKRFRALQALATKIPRKILCSGTPAPNGFHWEMYAQMKVIRPRLMGSWTDFVARYTVPRKNPFGGFDYNKNRLADELAFLLGRCFQVRRLKRDVLADLPTKTRQQIWLDTKVPATLTNTYKTWEQLQDEDFKKKTLLSQLFKMTCDAKIPPVLKYLQEADLPKRFLIFAHHKAMMHAIHGALRSNNVAIITGETAMDERQRIVQAFQQDMTIDRLVLSLGACGTGLTLTKGCTDVFFSELHWSPSNLLQAEDRTHRIGVQGHVHVHYLVVKNTLDDLMWRILQKKINNINKLDQRNDRSW